MEEIITSSRVTLSINGMHCGSCVKRVERVLKGTPGVTAATVLLVKQQAVVEYDPLQVTVEALTSAVAAQGYAVTGALPVVNA